MLLAERLFSQRRNQWIFLLAASLLLFLGRPHAFSLSNNDDAFYAQKAKEMLQSGNYWTVPYHHQPSFENTPLPFWLMAASFGIFGVSALSAVIPSALMAAATVLLLLRFGEDLFRDRRTAWLAALILLFPGFYTDYARRAMVDATLTFFVTAAMFCFYRGLTGRRWFLLYGLCTGAAILSKSILGVFPFIVAPAFLLVAGLGRKIIDPLFLAGMALAALVGFSWYAVQWCLYDEDFFNIHFGWLIVHRGVIGVDDSKIAEESRAFSHFNYVLYLLKNHLPWAPIAFWGLYRCGVKTIRERDHVSLLLLLWVAVTVGTMSMARSQTLRYILSVFPALALISAKTIDEWLSAENRERLILGLVSVIVVAVVFVNATSVSLKQSVSLSERSVEIRALAPFVHVNTRPDEVIGNFRLSTWNPRNALYFYSNRYLDNPVTEDRRMLARLQAGTQTTWLTGLDQFRRLEAEYPGKLCLIQSRGNYAYYTSSARCENVRREFAPDLVTVID